MIIYRWLVGHDSSRRRLAQAASEVTKVLLFTGVRASAQVGCPALEVTKVSLCTVIGSYQSIACSRPCPGGLSHPRSYQIVVIYSARASAQVG